MPAFVQVLLTVLLVVSVAAALTFWNQILYWADKVLYPWIRDNLPELEFDVRNAFAALDKVITPIRNNIKALKKFTEIKEAWKTLREYLLKVLVHFEQKTSTEWVKQITYWIIRNLKSKQVAQVVVEETVNADSLPPDVRQEWVRKGSIARSVDVTGLRDQEINEHTMTY